MRDIDNIIANVSGQTNYMESLSKITGNIMHCDIDLYKFRITEILKNEDIIKNIIKKYDINKLNKTELNKLFNEYIIESTKMEFIEKSISIYQKKQSKKAKNKNNKIKNPKPIIAIGYSPRELVKSKWFSYIKQLEKTSRKIITKLGYSDEKSLEENWTNIDNSFMENCNRELITWLDYQFNNINDLENIIKIHSAVNNIIDILLEPMYNYKNTIEKNWHLIGNVFNRNTSFSPELVQSILGRFIVAKYRCELFNTSKYYVKLFNEILNTPEMMDTNGELDGVKFMEIIDSIDLDQFDKSANTYKFITSAAPIMRKLIDPNCEESPEDILAEINNKLINNNNKDVEENEHQNENNDIFN